ncbi:UDPGT domain-containing protein [Meloidogyne graminicola]|uniref:glucuronosyltransferase n=1 Tax=Meloidogyne graminicola TaxID=189291 RepID=A0A8S9ZLK0_9BILA|nr:UDPGT domain-containing protein [Meloidogyne graminicola]
MSSFLKNKNETTKVNKIYLIEKSLENEKLLDFKHSSMVADSFNKKRPIFSFFDHIMTQFGPMVAMSCKEIIQKRELIQKLTSEHFDVGIAEMYDFCGIAVFHQIGVRTRISAYAIPLFQSVARIFDIPSFTSFTSNFIVAQRDLQSSFTSRFINFYNEFYDWIWMDNFCYRLQDPIIRKEFGNDFPNLRHLVKNVSLIFFNSNPFFEMPRPISNKVIYIGGLVDEQMSENNKKLEPNIKRILDEANNGAILFSLGSITDTSRFSKQMLSSIIGAFKQFPQIQFIWKLDKEIIKNIPSLQNVHTFEWIRQIAILAHPNLKAFITHCGQNSLTEAARAGIAIIGIPLFGDQYYNADVAEKHGMGLQIDINQLNGVNAENILVEAIQRILNDQSFSQNAKLIAKKIKVNPI